MARVLLRRASEGEWTLNNPRLLAGEIGVDLSNGRLKVGDGVRSWNDLPWADQAGAIESTDDTITVIWEDTNSAFRTSVNATLGEYLKITDANADFLSLANAAATYLSQVDAAADYASKEDLLNYAPVDHNHGDVLAWEALTQTEYDALPVKVATTLYLITGP